MESINISEAKSHFSETVSRAAAGEHFVIHRRERPIAALIGSNELERLQRSAQAARQLALALGQQIDLLDEIEKGEIHPIMASFGLWRDESDLADLDQSNRQHRIRKRSPPCNTQSTAFLQD